MTGIPDSRCAGRRSSPAPAAASVRRSRPASSRTASTSSPWTSRSPPTRPPHPASRSRPTSRPARATRPPSPPRVERFGRLDIVVANAGFQHVAPIADFPEDRWDAILAILLTSPFLLAKYAWPHLVASGQGRVPRRRLGARPRRVAVQGRVRVGQARRPRPREDPRARGRPGRHHDVRDLPRATSGRRWWRSRSPTRRRRTACPRSGCSRRSSSPRSAVKRMVEPDEVADMAAFLLGPGGASVTGVAIPMDQGWTAR